KLWEVLGQLYHAFHNRLEEQGKIASVMEYRRAASILKQVASENRLPYKKYVFVGFNVLSPAEIKIFSILRDFGFADFYWDYNSPAFSDGFNRAGKFIEKNIQEFPSIYELPEDKITDLPEIEIIGVPSSMAQVKLAGSILRDWAQSGIIKDKDNAVDTAIVLPDESLFIGLRRSIPYDVIKNINVTMGLPLKLTPIAALMKIIVNLQLRLRFSGGVPTFYYEDILSVINNNFIKTLAPEEVEALENAIITNRHFRMTQEQIGDIAPSLASIFSPLFSIRNNEAVYDYITNIIALIEPECNPTELKFLNAYMDAVKSVKEHCVKFETEIKPATFFRMVEQTVAGEKINMIGEPLKGLQMMGVLETRALDFDNIVMLSMNERIFPKKHYTGSFIPDALRRGYGMATADFQESIFAYYFYRLIARAKRVKLIYDARTVGTKTGEMSRYLTQLIYLFGNSGKVRTSLKVFSPLESTSQTIEIDKNTPGILEKLEQFKSGSHDKKYISASALNTYISCPLEFYLRYVEGFNDDKDLNEFMDSGTYGTIVHDVLEEIYRGISSRHGDIIPGEEIEMLLKPDSTVLDRLIVSHINKEYNKLDDSLIDSPLEGETLIMGKVMKESITSVLKADLNFAPLTLIEAERSIPIDLKINDNLSVNFKLKIDRIDMSNGQMRIIDYKTGDDDNSVTDWAQCFDHDAHNYKKKAVGQVMLYAYTYNLSQKQSTPIALYIYNLRKIFSSGPQQVKVKGKLVNNHNEHIDEFTEHLNATIAEIFDPNVPFFQANDESSCKFCAFKAMCRRD
ncbi:MAG: PD-(D/E)XK nuclease family protein, partial [Paramuribaculum sp.]|nr:PD-(D/E)XK nuclease family protein [Paramuribaculum sp.]